MTEPGRIDARAVAGAAGSMVARTLGGIALGALVGIAAFVIERGMGWLAGDGWRGIVVWLMLPLYALGGAAAMGFTFAIGGIRRAAARLLVDSGVLRRMVERGLAKVRGAAERDDADDAAPRGWLGRRLQGIARVVSQAIIALLGATPGTAEAETKALIDRKARDMIDDWYAMPVYLSWLALAALLVVPPLLL